MDGMPMPMTPPSNGTMYMKDDMMMHMSLFWGKNVTILFQRWPGTSLGMYILSLFFVFLLSFCVEVLSFSAAVKPGTNSLVGAFTLSLVYALRTVLSYMVMLAVMSFNIGIFLVAVAGHVVGFFLVKYRALSEASKVAEV